MMRMMPCKVMKRYLSSQQSSCVIKSREMVEWRRCVKFFLHVQATMRVDVVSPSTTEAREDYMRY